MGLGETTVDLVTSCSRMMDLLDVPRDISFFSKLIQREIIYRLLQGSQGARLRAIATFETKCHRTSKAVAWLRSNYEKPLGASTCSRTPDQSAFDATAVNTWSAFRHRRGSAESVGQSHLVFNPRVQSIQFWLVLVVAMAV